MDTITLDSKRPEILRAVEFAKSKGATALKIELEGNLSRFDEYDDYTYCEWCEEGSVSCDECDGDGALTCAECDGEGRVTDGEGTRVTCPNVRCNGGRAWCDYCDEGYRTCPECDGDYRREPDYHWTNERALYFMLHKLGINVSDEDNDRYSYDPELCDWLQFAKFYNDGSVDSEITLTIRLDNPENIFRAHEVINVWNELVDEIGNGIDVNGAGMHMAWIFSPDCSYPNSDDVLSRRQLNHFALAMNQMMPALYFLAAPANGENWTRGFGYRGPNVSLGEHKYSAIHFRGNSMEFRVFDTCYDTPEQVLDNVVVMSNSLKYLAERYVGPRMYRDRDYYGFGNDNNRSLDRLYQSEDLLDMLYAYVDKLKPRYYTMRQLRKQRGLTVTKSSLRKRIETIKQNAQLAWREYEERWGIVRGISIEEQRYSLMRQFVESTPVEQLREMSEDEIRERVEERVTEYISRLDSRQPERESFIHDREERQMREYQPEFSVSFR